MEYLNWVSDHDGFILLMTLITSATYTVPRIVASIAGNR
jgi:hypothetical protein